MNSLSSIFILLSALTLLSRAQSPSTLFALCPEYSVTAAQTDPLFSNQTGGFILYVFDTDITEGVQQFEFVNGVGSLSANPFVLNLTGDLIPRPSSGVNSSFGWLLDVEFQFTSASFEGVDELLPSAPINISNWSFWELTQGSLTGTGSNAGQTITITQQMEKMPLQVGDGANGKNFEFGAAVWVTLTKGNETSAGDFNLDLNCTSTSSTTTSTTTSSSTTSSPTTTSSISSGTTAVVSGSTSTSSSAATTSGSTSTSTSTTGSISSTTSTTSPSTTSTTTTGNNTPPPSSPCPHALTALPAACDSFCNTSGDHALYFFSPPQNIAQQYVFQQETGFLDLSSNPNGATLIGTLVPSSGSGDNLNIDFVFAKTSGTPFLELEDDAYVSNGGPINPSTWEFYTLLPNVSSLVSTGVLTSTPTSVNVQTGMVLFQVGNGASGKNIGFGASGWFTLTLNPNTQNAVEIFFDINISLNCSAPPPEPSSCLTQLVAEPALVDSFATNTGGVSFSFFGNPPALGDGLFIFANDTGRVSIQNNQLHLTGLLTAEPGHPSGTVNQWSVNLWFDFTSNPGVPPHLQLTPNAYKDNGGVVDPSTWSFYFIDTNSSAITGDGFTLQLSTQMGLPLQVGVGANGKNVQYGASGWFDYALIAPNGTVTFTSGLDINVNLHCPLSTVIDSQSTPSSSGRSDPSSASTVTLSVFSLIALASATFFL